MILVQQSPPPPDTLDDTRDGITEVDQSLTRSTNLLVEGKYFYFEWSLKMGKLTIYFLSRFW